MDDNSLNNKPEPLLRFINPTSNPGISFDKPGNFRTFATLFSLSLILIGGAFLTSWLVFRQSKNRRDRHKVQGILKKTRLDTVKNYHSAISTLTRQNKVLGKTASSILQGEFSIILALAHDIPDYVVKGNYLATITGKRNIHQRELLKSMTSITRLLIQKRFQEAAMLIEQEMVSFPRSHLHLYALALARMELGNWEAANSSVSMAIELGQKPIPYRLLQAIIERKRGKKAHAASILQGILRQSPGHGHALLEQYLLTGKGTLPSPSQYVSRRELAKVWLSLGMAQEIPSEKKKRCITAQKYWYMPETSICIAQAILRGAGELETTEDHLAHLTPYPIPQVKLLRVEYFIKQLNPDKALKSLVSLKTCKTCDQGAIASLALATAILIEDRDAVKKTCAGKQSPAMIHQCLEGALDLREWPLVKNLVKQLPQGVIPSLIRQAIFSHSLAPAFLPIPKKLLPYEAKILARTLIAAQKYSLAIQLLVANQKENGRNHSLDLVMARAYAAMGRNSRALSILDTVRPHILNHPRSLFETARIYLRLNKLGAAQSIAARISKIVPEGYRSLFLKCLIYLHKKAYDKATKSLEEATKVTTLNPNLLTARARILFFEGKYPDAIKAIEQAVAIDLENPRYFETLARYSRHYKQAHYGIYYLKAAAKYRALAAPYQASRVLATYGETLDIKTMRDEKSKVVAQLERIKKLHPRALAFLAEWQHNQDMNSKKAIVLMEQAIALAPDLPVHSYKLATWLATSQPKKAIKILEKLIVAYSYHAITPMAETLLATLRKGVTP